MITANKGMTKVAGTNYDIIFEFNTIISSLLQDNPEIVLGTITAWSDIMDEQLKSVNKTKLVIVADIAEKIIKLDDESEDDNG